jgi:hypothetical protein
MGTRDIERRRERGGVSSPSPRSLRPCRSVPIAHCPFPIPYVLGFAPILAVTNHTQLTSPQALTADSPSKTGPKLSKTLEISRNLSKTLEFSRCFLEISRLLFSSQRHRETSQGAFSSVRASWPALTEFKSISHKHLQQKTARKKVAKSRKKSTELNETRKNSYQTRQNSRQLGSNSTQPGRGGRDERPRRSPVSSPSLPVPVRLPPGVAP